MKKVVSILTIALSVLTLVLTGCENPADKPVVMVWYPNESGEEMKGARDALAKVVEEALGRPVEHRLTTDYNIAIEAIANGQAAIGFFGAQGYVLANKKNPKVQPVVVNSGASGTLSDAMYYSWLAVLPENADIYRLGDGFSMDMLPGKKFSWVSTSSTSGFKVPSAGIVSYFNKKPEWANLKAEDLLEGGEGKFFKEVLFGSSHQGSAVNLLTGLVDVAAFCDTCVANYVQLDSGSENTPGAIYKVKEGAAEPFQDQVGKTFEVIRAVPVLNAPFVTNSEILDAASIAKLTAAMTADAVAANPLIFAEKGSDVKALFRKGERFVAVQDAWFQPIRDLNE